MNNTADYKRIVVKIGSSTMTHDTGKLNLYRLETLARVLSDLKNAGREIILVSSGAVAAGAAGALHAGDMAVVILPVGH